MAVTAAADAAMEDFDALIAESFGDHISIEGSVVKGIIVSIEGDSALIDVGLGSR